MVGWGESCCSDFVRCVRSSWLGFYSSSFLFLVVLCQQEMSYHGVALTTVNAHRERALQ